MFIHFNSATYQFASGPMVDWEYNHENNGAARKYPFDPLAFAPTKLDPTQWAKAAKSAGMEFAALTAKHHEGFSLWPSKCTSHCVKNATVKTDVVKAYLDAFRAEGIVAGLYFSMLDLHHQIGRNKCTPEDKQFILNQLYELLTQYGEIPFIIIDGWHAAWGGPTYDKLPFEEVNNFIKQLQPNCLLMNISCESNLSHSEIVFYENAAGQEVEDSFVGPGASCNILTDQWFFRDTDPIKELKKAQWVLDKLQDYGKKNVTFILNASPNKEGLIDHNLLQRYEEIGRKYKKIPDLKELPNGWLTR